MLRRRDVRAHDESLYAYRCVGEGVFGVLTVEFWDGVKAKKREKRKQE